MNTTGIGARVKRVEDKRFLLGKGRYVGDIKINGMQDVAFLRSSHAHARICSVKIPDTHKQSTVTHADMVGVKSIVANNTLPNFQSSEYWALAKNKVRFVGEPIAMCIGKNRAEAEDIVELVDVQYEELDALVDVKQSRQNDAIRIHEHWENNLFVNFVVGEDFAKIKESADIVVEREYTTARQVMNPMEGKGVVAYWDEKENQLVVYSSTQVAHLIRTALSDILGISQLRIRVLAPDVGGGFGYKCVLQPEEVAVAWLALTRRAAFRWLEDRREHLVAGANCRQHYYRIKAYANAQGKLLGIDAVADVDAGAYSSWPFTIGLEPAQIGGNLPGPYDLKNYRCAVSATATNKPPFIPYRGVARPGVCFAIELTIDAIARAVGREAWQVRDDNLIPLELMPHTNITGKHYDSGNYQESLRRAVKMIGFDMLRERQKRGETDGRKLGIGFSTFTEQSAHGTRVFSAWGGPMAPGHEEARVKLTADGCLEVYAGINAIGQGIQTTLGQVASEILTIPIDNIRVVLGDTETTPYSTGAYASRGIVMAGGAVSLATENLVVKIKKLAAFLLDCDETKLQLADGQVQGPDRAISLEEIGESWYLRPERLVEAQNLSGLEATGYYKPDVDSGAFSYSTHAVALLVDTQTGSVEILDYAIVDDCGQMVNPMIVEGQAIGGTAQGIGTALYEKVIYNNQGQPVTSTLADYILPGPNEIPNIRIQHMQTLSPYTAYGIKGVGEGGAIAPAGAIVNAINDALAAMGVEINEIPATPEVILNAVLRTQDTQMRAAGGANETSSV